MPKEIEVTTICITKQLHARLVKHVHRIHADEKKAGMRFKSRAQEVYEEIIRAGLAAKGAK